MDMTLLSKMIEELLGEHDCVTLPGLGSVCTEEVEAGFSDRGYTINPPYRKISFRPGEGGDTLLCDLYARNNCLSTEDSKAMLSGFLQQIKAMLGERKTVLFPGLGLLRATKDDSYIFIQEEGSEVWPEYFGLQPLSLKNHQFQYEAVPEMKVIPRDVPVPESAEKPDGPRAADDIKMPEAAAHAAETDPGQTGGKARPSGRAVRRVLLGTLAAVILALVLLRILGTAAPEFIDRLLYTPEELRIIYY